jgi:hypothetical protein|uniref:Uncharacterized protein n=1 Tax=viral metagenome TaxID=1070528 RepID=A0A6C0CXB7_9ZZZZ
MESINLDVNEYTDKEIEDILTLEYPYQYEDIQKSKGNLLNKLTQDNEVDSTTKRRIENFLDAASNRLISIISASIENSHYKQKDKFSEMKNDLYRVNDNFIIKNEKLRKEAYKLESIKGLNIGEDGGAPPGIINPIRYTTIKRALNIDSRFRPNYYQTSSSDQRLTLPYKFENVINMRLASIEIPLSYYAISRALGNNSLVISWDISGNDTTAKHFVRITLPDGNYETAINETTGATLIESAMNAALRDPNQDILGGGQTIISDLSFSLVYTVDHTSGRSIFAIDPSGIDNYEQVLTNNPNHLRFRILMSVNGNQTDTDLIARDLETEALPLYLGWQLGYRTNIYDSGPPFDVSGVGMVPPTPVISEGLCYIKGPQYLFVAIDDYNNNVNNYYVSAYTDSINNNNILARINLASIQQSNGVYQTGEDDGFSTQINRSRNYFGPVNIEKLRITLYDEYGRIVNLNNMDWSCALMFEQVYDGGRATY